MGAMVEETQGPEVLRGSEGPGGQALWLWGVDMAEKRQSLFGLGTIPEWVGLILLLSGAVWTGSTLVSDLKGEMQQQRHEMQAQIATIANSVEKIHVAVANTARIAELERDSKLKDVKNLVDKNSEDIDHIWKRINKADTL